MDSLIELRHVKKTFSSKVVLKDINLKILKGEYISITGESGVGKSTLMNILGCLDKEFAGNYFFHGEKLQKRFFNTFRNEHIGFIFQQYHLIPNLTVWENIMLPYVYSRKECRGIGEKAEQLLGEFHMLVQREQVVSTLSGGEKQRIALIRSSILEPEIMLADEPTGNLDESNGKLVRDFLMARNSEGKTIIVVTHNPDFAREAGRHFCIRNGELDEY